MGIHILVKFHWCKLPGRCSKRGRGYKKWEYATWH